MTTNTPEVKTYTWEQLIGEPGLYSPIDWPTDGWMILVLENKYDMDDDGWSMKGDYKQPEVILLYHRELKIFNNLSIGHCWYQRTFVKIPETIIIRD